MLMLLEPSYKCTIFSYANFNFRDPLINIAEIGFDQFALHSDTKIYFFTITFIRNIKTNHSLHF